MDKNIKQVLFRILAAATFCAATTAVPMRKRLGASLAAGAVGVTLLDSLGKYKIKKEQSLGEFIPVGGIEEYFYRKQLEKVGMNRPEIEIYKKKSGPQKYCAEGNTIFVGTMRTKYSNGYYGDTYVFSLLTRQDWCINNKKLLGREDYINLCDKELRKHEGAIQHEAGHVADKKSDAMGPLLFGASSSLAYSSLRYRWGVIGQLLHLSAMLLNTSLLLVHSRCAEWKADEFIIDDPQTLRAVAEYFRDDEDYYKKLVISEKNYLKKELQDGKGLLGKVKYNWAMSKLWFDEKGRLYFAIHPHNLKRAERFEERALEIEKRQEAQKNN